MIVSEQEMSKAVRLSTVYIGCIVSYPSNYTEEELFCTNFIISSVIKLIIIYVSLTIVLDSYKQVAA